MLDPAGDTKVTNNPFASRGFVSAMPAAVLATDKDRLSVEAIGKESFIRNVTADQGASAGFAGTLQPGMLARAANLHAPLQVGARREALDGVEKQLVSAGLLDRIGVEGRIAPAVQKKYSFELTSALPTPGMYVTGCLDQCNVCEKELMVERELDIERKKLENEKLKKQIALLEKSQEYRCFPFGTHAGALKALFLAAPYLIKVMKTKYMHDRCHKLCTLGRAEGKGGPGGQQRRRPWRGQRDRQALYRDAKRTREQGPVLYPEIPGRKVTTGTCSL